MQRSADTRASFCSFAALMTVLSLLAPTLAGCSPSGSGQATSGPAMGSGSGTMQQRAPMQRAPAAPQQQGMSTGKKIAILAGTAALIYLYNKHKNKKGTGEQGQYYRSESTGRIYYRDKNNNAVFVTPPKEGIRVPAEEAEIYRNAEQTGTWDVPTSRMPGGPGSLSGPARSY